MPEPPVAGLTLNADGGYSSSGRVRASETRGGPGDGRGTRPTRHDAPECERYRDLTITSHRHQRARRPRIANDPAPIRVGAPALSTFCQNGGPTFAHAANFDGGSRRGDRPAWPGQSRHQQHAYRHPLRAPTSRLNAPCRNVPVADLPHPSRHQLQSSAPRAAAVAGPRVPPTSTAPGATPVGGPRIVGWTLNDGEGNDNAHRCGFNSRVTGRRSTTP